MSVFCIDCGIERHPASKEGRCKECVSEYRKLEANKRYYDKLIDMGFILHSPRELLYNKRSKYDVTNTECGHRFQAQGGNLLTGNTRCSVCGPKKRMAGALKAYMLKYGRTYDLKKEEDYRKLVRSLSEKNWRAAHPDSPKRARVGLHLDHIIPISWCFKNGQSLEFASDIENLVLMDSKSNISKGCRISDFGVFKKLVEKHSDKTIQIVEGSKRIQECFTLFLNKIQATPTLMDAQQGIIEYGSQRILIQDVDGSNDVKAIHQPGDIMLFSDEIEYSSNADRRFRIAVSRINNALGNVKKVRASKLRIELVTDSMAASRFMSTCHFQGRGNGARIKLGLFDGDEIVSIMTFSKPRFTDAFQWELVRFASKIDHRVYGAASKLFKYFVDVYNPESIISYSDRRWGKGVVYEQLGFEKRGVTPPNYWWAKDGRKISRYQTRLKDLTTLLGSQFDQTKSEKENMQDAGWTFVQDLGSDKFIWFAKAASKD